MKVYPRKAVNKLAIGLAAFWSFAAAPTVALDLSTIKLTAHAVPLSGCTFAPSHVSPTQMAPIPIAEAVRCLINAERTAQGLPEVALNAQLSVAAQGLVADAVKLKWWKTANAHIDPVTDTGLSVSQAIYNRISRSGYCGGKPLRTGEIAYSGYGDSDASTPYGAVKWWMNSPPHKAIILDPQLKEIGIGVAPDSAFEGGANPLMGTYVADFGTCNYLHLPNLPSLWNQKVTIPR